MVITQQMFKNILPRICDRDTSQDPDSWTPQNRLWGHCAVVSLLAQNIFGGKLHRASLSGVKGWEHARSHYWNFLPLGAVVDFTQEQFGKNYPDMTNLTVEERERSYVLSFEPTRNRYKLLAWRFAQIMSDGNPIFQDQLYRECLMAALDSDCQKMWFGCVITHNGEIVSRTANKQLDPLKHICQPKCIRFNIQSRTESMIGACGHAEELGLWNVDRQNIPLNECDLYIAGLTPNGLPTYKEGAEHTCLRCAVQMFNAKVRKIYVPVVNHWESLTADDAMKTALLYTMREKEVR